MRSLSLSPPSRSNPFSQNSGAPAGNGRGDPAEPYLAGIFTHRGPEGCSGGGLHAVLLSPWDALPPRATQVVFWREGKGQREVGEGSLSVQVSSPGPSAFTHLPLSLTPASPTPRKAAGRAAAAERLAVGRRGQGARARAPRGGRCGRP